MNGNELYNLRLKELHNKVFDLKENLEVAKEKAFSAHESYLASGKTDVSHYEAACKERDMIKDELIRAESELNNLTSRIHEEEFRKHENDNANFGIHSKNLMNIAFVFLGLAFALLIKKLFS